MGTFKLEIKLGNEAMNSPQDIGLALRSLSRRVAEIDVSDEEVEGIVRDTNGNRVGAWSYVNEDADVEEDT